ncbi:hypothetical protein BH09PSE4_BH09PSE4_12550 [soil metagenome]
MELVIGAALLFVGSHFLLSHPMRAGLVEQHGERMFLAIYSLVALVTLGLLVLAYRLADDGAALWEVGDPLWGIVTAVMWLASILLVGSFIGNPGFPQSGEAAVPPPVARGVFVITRHPMMWAFALWGLSHIAVLPTWPNIVLCGAIVFLALVGAALQDAKKRARYPQLWRAWEARTSYWPFGVVGGGKYRKRAAWPGFIALIGGTLLWLAATWAHLPLAGWAAGIWRWLDPDLVRQYLIHLT